MIGSHFSKCPAPKCWPIWIFPPAYPVFEAGHPLLETTSRHPMNHTQLCKKLKPLKPVHAVFLQLSSRKWSFNHETNSSMGHSNYFWKLVNFKAQVLWVVALYLAYILGSQTNLKQKIVQIMGKDQNFFCLVGFNFCLQEKL